jgi:hypothetical protein
MNGLHHAAASAAGVAWLLQPGRTVRISGLVGSSHLNGELALCVGVDPNATGATAVGGEERRWQAPWHIPEPPRLPPTLCLPPLAGGGAERCQPGPALQRERVLPRRREGRPRRRRLGGDDCSPGGGKAAARK